MNRRSKNPIHQPTFNSGDIHIRANVRNLSTFLLSHNWEKYREDLLKRTKKWVAGGEKTAFGTHVDLVKVGPHRRRLPLYEKDLSKLGRDADGNECSIADAVIRTILPSIVNPSRNFSYTVNDYRLLSAAIFIDPVGSSAQEFHDDMHGFDRHAVWNIVIPLQLPEGFATQVAENKRDSSEYMSRGGKRYIQGMDDAVVWDANWPHRGAGNPTDTDRVQLHLIFAPKWMLCGLCGQERLPQGITQEDVTHARSEIAKEYNNDKEILDFDTPVGYWVKRVIDEAEPPEVDMTASEDVFIDESVNEGESPLIVLKKKTREDAEIEYAIVAEELAKKHAQKWQASSAGGSKLKLKLSGPCDADSPEDCGECKKTPSGKKQCEAKCKSTKAQCKRAAAIGEKFCGLHLK